VTSWTGKRRNDSMSRTACWWVMGSGLHSEDIDGCKSFGAWPLTQAAQACFGTPDWPVERPVPQASVEFEVADAETVQVAADELKEKGLTLLHDARTEPWGQTVARLQSNHRHLLRALDALAARRNVAR
jgi:hypothetical protein